MKAYADQRHETHKDHASSRPLSKDYELVGLMGELALSQLTGLAPDLKVKPKGDGGVDGRIYLGFSVDVKTARKPYNLIHEVGKKFADIFILAQYNGESAPATMLGFEWGVALAVAPTKKFGHEILNHYIPAHLLRPMEELERRVIKFS